MAPTAGSLFSSSTRKVAGLAGESLMTTSGALVVIVAMTELSAYPSASAVSPTWRGRRLSNSKRPPASVRLLPRCCWPFMP